MDYIVFVVDQNGGIVHYGSINNVKDIYEAKRKLQSNINIRHKSFYLVKSEDFKKVIF